MANELAIIRKENIDLIVSSVPSVYAENTDSRNRCTDFGNDLLDRMLRQGMTDELDQLAARYIERTRKTVRKMNDRRAPLTKLFDEIRAQFTAMENAIDPTKAGTAPFLIQQERNHYAARKREEELARQREAMRLQQIEQEKSIYRSSCEAVLRRAFNSTCQFYIDGLQDIFGSVTLENYEQRLHDLQQAAVAIPEAELSACSMPRSTVLPEQDAREIGSQVFGALITSFREEFRAAMQKERQRLIDLMPSKKMELERAAQASAEEAARIRQQMKEREEAEAKTAEQERIEREKKQRIEADMQSKRQMVGDLFDNAQVTKPIYQPKTTVKKKLIPLNPEAFPEIISMWWNREGCNKSVEELSKVFKKQIAFCEKCANNGEIIESEHIYYEDEVKAK